MFIGHEYLIRALNWLSRVYAILQQNSENDNDIFIYIESLMSCGLWNIFSR